MAFGTRHRLDTYRGPEPQVERPSTQERREALNIERWEPVADSDGTIVAYVIDPEVDETGHVELDAVADARRGRFVVTGRCDACGVLLAAGTDCDECVTTGIDASFFVPGGALARRNGGER